MTVGGKVDPRVMMFQEWDEKHLPARCEAFKKMTPQQWLKKITD
jgi:hypothetical protein